MKNLSNRTGQFTESVIRRMTRVSDLYDAVNLSQGFPDFDPPEAITRRLAEVALSGPHQYAITYGATNFREALARKQSHFSGVTIDPATEIVVTAGSTEAMMAAMLTVTDPGDKVVVFSPFYENYGADAILSGAQPIYVPLKPPSFDFDPVELETALAQDGVKALILCNPSNPSGKVFRHDELRVIAELAQKYDIYVITDEVYEHIVYAPHQHAYLSTLPGMRERTIICGSLSKTYSITGWRLGYTIASPEVTERLRAVHDFLTVGAAAPLMEAAVTALNFDVQYYEDLIRDYTHSKDLFIGGLRDLDLAFIEPQGAYYVLVDVSEFHVKDDVRFCEWMAREVGVGTVPGSSFFREDINHLVRFHFAKKDATLNEALNRLATLKKKAHMTEHIWNA